MNSYMDVEIQTNISQTCCIFVIRVSDCSDCGFILISVKAF